MCPAAPPPPRASRAVDAADRTPSAGLSQILRVHERRPGSDVGPHSHFGLGLAGRPVAVRCLLASELGAIQLGVQPGGGQQLGVLAPFDDMARRDHEDLGLCGARRRGLHAGRLPLCRRPFGSLQPAHLARDPAALLGGTAPGLLRLLGDLQRDRDLLWARSPLSRVDQIRIPILIGQGANDPRVKPAESEQVVAALARRGIDCAYLLFPDEGHGLAKPANRLRFYGAAEDFLAQHLLGKGPGVSRSAQG